MNQPNARTLTLFDLLARRWQATAAVAAACFAAEGAAAFATADGKVLIAGDPDPEPPEARIRITGDLGQLTIRPRSLDAPPLVAVTGLADRAPPLAVAGDGFLTGDADGRVLRLGVDGTATPVLSLGGAITALDACAGAVAAADPGTLMRRDAAGATERLPLAGIAALAFAPGGRALAAADAAQLHLLAPGPRAKPLLGAGRLAWSPDGCWLAAALGSEGVALIEAGGAGDGRLSGFPGPVASLGWSAPGGALVVGGAFRIAAWAAAALPETEQALVTGQPGLVLVEAVAPHPVRPLVAAGYANGQVVVARLGARDELLLRPDGAAVTALAWSPDGRNLAIGDAAGGAAIASFPAQMFK